MKRHVLIYGIAGGVLITLMQWSEYRFLVVEHSFEIYAGLIAAIFAGLGIWFGIRLTRKPAANETAEALVPDGQSDDTGGAGTPFLADEKRRGDLGITRRELEILELMAQGMSNREIAGKLFVSENTVKTHSSRVFDKLGARRRTQAVLLGKEFGLLP
jgi:DNA-binding CsgD family transcriptional regulator